MITFVYPYYENGGMLERHLYEWASYRPEVKEHVRAIIVDDGSPRDAALNHWRDCGFQAALYRIKENIPWNVPGARNLGMDQAPEGWCLLTDIDHLLDADAANTLVDLLPSLNETYAYTLSRRWADGRLLHPHPNSYIIQRSAYWQAGGTDEDWSGYWGAGEQAFRKCLRRYCPIMGPIFNVFLTHFGRDDIKDASTRDWGRRDSSYDWRKNPFLAKKLKADGYRPENPLRFEWKKVAWNGADDFTEI